MSSDRKLHLNLNFRDSGTFGSAWRWEGNDPFAFIDVDYFIRMAKICERGTFDALFLGDHPSLSSSDAPDFRPFLSLEPTVLLAAIAAATTHIGLIATASSTYNEPYNIARRFASLDHISRGRAAVNVVTTADPESAYNFGLDEMIAKNLRYERAREFCEVMNGLWDSWEDDALVGDKATGRFVDMSKVHRIDYKGDYLSVRGPLNVPRAPQGRPVMFQAGGSPAGIALAARFADAVFSNAHTLEDARAYSDALRSEAAGFGRDPQALRIFPGLAMVLGGTEAEARAREKELGDLVPIEHGMRRLGGMLGIDPAILAPMLDKPVPDDLAPSKDGRQAHAMSLLNKGRRENLTLRQLIRSQGGGTNHPIMAGTPEQVADRMCEWFLAGVCDGFNVMPDVNPSGLEDFVDHVVPILRKRGLFREAYEGTTLRDHLGISRPASGGRTTGTANIRPTADMART